MHKSLVSISGIGLGIDSGASTKIEHVCARGQQIKRQFLKSVADQPISLRSQHELAVLLSGMHVDDCLGQGESVSNVGYRGCRRTKERLHHPDLRRRPACLHFHPAARAAHPAAVFQIALFKGARRAACTSAASAAKCDPSRDRALACPAGCVAHWRRHNARSLWLVAAAAALRNMRSLSIYRSSERR